RTHMQREESGGRIGHVEAVEHVEYLITLSAGHVDVAEIIENYTGIEAQQVANIARGWIWNVEYLTAVHRFAGSSLRGVNSILIGGVVYGFLYLLQLLQGELNNAGCGGIHFRHSDQVKAVPLRLDGVNSWRQSQFPTSGLIGVTLGVDFQA